MIHKGGESLHRWVVLAMWVGATLGGGALISARYRAAVADRPYDFHEYFLPAGQLILGGRSPFDEAGYVYSPIVALLAAGVAKMADPVAGWATLSLAAGVLAVILFLCAIWAELRPWQRPAMALIAIGTLYYNWQTTIMMGLGQTETHVLMAMCAASFAVRRRRYGLLGSALGLAALIKTWPVVSGLWLLRRKAEHRWLTAFWAIGCVGLGVVATALVFGPGSVLQWIANVMSARAQSGLVHFSAWEVGRQLFGDAVGGKPLRYDPGLAVGLTALAVAVAAALLLVSLLAPGDALLSKWHTFFAAILLLPVAHSFYLLYALPILWIHASRWLKEPGNIRFQTMFGIWLFWWIVTSRIQWSGDMVLSVSTMGYAAMMGASYIALICSVVVESLGKWDEPEVDASGQ